MTQRLPWRPALALAVGVLCISCSAIFVKNAAVPGATSAFYRLAFALLCTVPLVCVRPIRRPPREALVAIACGGAAFAVELVLWQMALLSTSAAHATLLVNLAPLWVGIGALLFLGEPQAGRFWAGALVAFLGMGIVVQLGHHGGLALKQGDVLAAAGSVFYAVYLLVTRRQRRTIDTVSFLVWSTVAAVLVAFGFCIVLQAPLSGFSGSAWANLLALGLVSHLGGYLAINYALGHIRVAKVAVALLAQPVVTAVLAFGFLGEPITLALATGGATAVAGLVLALSPSGAR